MPASGDLGDRRRPTAAASAPAIALPKGGGAIRGIGEAFAANPVTGTGSLTIPLPLSPGRGGFTPALALGYDSGAGNGPYGCGWSISYPAITRRTDRGLPTYRDAEGADVFLLSGAEDLVPVLGADGAPVSEERDGWHVARYRPRVEGLFARIERWSRDEAGGEVFWRSISLDNVTTWFGQSAESRIVDPADPSRIFAWLLSETRDDRGNAAVYEYVPEDSRSVDIGAAHEATRSETARSANRYLKRIKYGNTISHLQPGFEDTGWLFELVMDYGDHAGDRPAVEPDRDWPVRPDPFSSRRSAFEVRTYRRCHRVLMFHRFAELGPDPRLVRALTLDYDDRAADAPPDAAADLAHAGSTALGSFLRRATMTGFADSGLARSLPPLELEYSRPRVSDEVRALDAASAERLPVGVDGAAYQWIDFHNEGLAGVLTEQGGAWWYAPNRGEGRLGAQTRVAEQPTARVAKGVAFVDLAGDGLLDAAQFDGPVAGFFERTGDDTWATFRAFEDRPTLWWQDPNLRFVDLTGDGHADLLITEDQAIVWHEARGEAGYGPRQAVSTALDEAEGPRLVFSDTTGTVFLADMSGDGLADLVRVRNGEVCYWPNLGYGRFGPRITMDGAPVFDAPDLFNPHRVRLADIDGSGVADVIYLAADGVRLYFNCTGNRWTPPFRLHAFPPVDSNVDVHVADVLGNGTACLVWSSPLPRYSGAALMFVDLMGGQKPHLLTKVVNNLGADTVFTYRASTHFYLQDRDAGRPWISRLPFPVHVVERVTTEDRISRNRFVTRYAYHHGYFDGVEREFRGFGMVEQFDTEEFAALAAGQAPSPASNVDPVSHVPPVLTRTWYHTGVYFGRGHVSDFFAGLADEGDTGEYYREPGNTDAEARALLLDDTVLPEGLTSAEEQEACRALKGLVLRQEVYGLDGSEQTPHPYSVTEQNYTVRLEQARAGNRHAVFFTHPRETLVFDYERHPADPRVTHSLVLDVDAFGNVRQSASVAYGRRQPDPELDLQDQALQAKAQMTATEQAFTNAIDDLDAWRLPLVSESRRFEVTGFPLDGARLAYDAMREVITQAPVIPFERQPVGTTIEKRLLEHRRMRYRRDDLDGALPLGRLEQRALPFETHMLALTAGLVSHVFGDLVTDDMLAAEGRYVHSEGDLDWWAGSGRVFYSPHPEDDAASELAFATAHFFRVGRYRDPFHSAAVPTDAIVRYDKYDLLLLETQDATGNRTTVGVRDQNDQLITETNDYRVLAPRALMDANRNRTAVAFDALGMTVGTALMGKGSAEAEGDSLEDFDPDPDEAVVAAVLADPTAPQPVLARATTRVLYDAFAFHRTRHQAQPEPAVTCAIARDTHDAELAPGALSETHHVLTYSDGFEREIQRKSAAETGPVPLRDADGRLVLGADGLPLMTTTAHPRWISSGWTIYDNKGQPVRTFEPFFTDHARFESDVRIGVSAIQCFDPRGRVVARLHPDHTWEKAVFDAWRESNWDASDTVLVEDPAADPDVGDLFRRLEPSDYLPTWFAERTGGALGPLAQAAAVKAAVHAATPTITYADSLGRSVLTVAHNRFRHGHQPVSDPAVEEFHETRADLDIDGRQLGVRDAFGRVVLAHTFNLAGAPILRAGMDTGERRIFTDAVGTPLYSWDGRSHRLRMTYDVLRRLEDVFLSADGAAEIMVRRMEYGETAADGAAANLRGRIFRVHDESGVATNRRFDFKGNLTAAATQYAADGSAPLDWQQNPLLDPEVLATSTTFDARNRPVALVTPDLTECRYTFNRAGLVEQVGVLRSGSAQATAFIAGVEYDAFARQARIVHGNGVTTTLEYDRRSRRLVRRVSTGPGGALLQDLRYVHDPVGNITGIEDRAQQAVYFANQVVAADCAYTYDAMQRLIDASGREHIGQLSQPQPTWTDGPRVRRAHPSDGGAMRRYTEQYAYDAVGNLLRVVHQAANGGWTRTYAYSSPSLIDPTFVNNRLSSTQVGGDAAGAELYEHDAHGNMTSMGHLSLLLWDHHDRLRATARQVTIAGSPETTWYSYDSAGQRVRKLTARPNGTRASERRYTGRFEVYREYGANGTATVLERQTLHVMLGAERIALVETRTQGQDPAPIEQVRYQLADHLGSASIELNEAARVVSYEEYHPHGSTAFQSVDGAGVTPKRYRYTAMERDEESGLAYHGARYYAPWLGRWTRADPAGLVDGVNLYRYVRNRPSNAVDTSGTEEVDIDIEADAEKNVRSRQSISTRGRTFFHVLDWFGARPEYTVGFQMSDIQAEGFRVSEGAAAKYGKGVYTFADEATALKHAGFHGEKAIAAFEVGPDVVAERIELDRMGKRETYIRLQPAGEGKSVMPRNLQYLNVGDDHLVGYNMQTKETGRTPVPVRMAGDATTSPRGATSGGSGSGSSGGSGMWNVIKANPTTWAVRGLFVLDTAIAYDAISSQKTTYGQVKETSFWGGRLFGFAIGAKYGMALGPKGAIIGGILGALIGENAIKSVFAIGEAIGSDLVKPAGAETTRTQPSVQRHIQRGIDRATGMDEYNSAMDRMHQSGGR